MEAEERVILTPGQAAKRLAVSASGLRRLAEIYATVHGELPRDETNQRRLWTEEAVSRLEAARGLVQAERAKSIHDALIALDKGLEERVELDSAPVPTVGALGLLIEEIRALRLELAEMRQENAELRRALSPPSSHQDTSARDAELKELRWRNQYLYEELARRDREKEALARRPWWKFWGKSFNT